MTTKFHKHKLLFDENILRRQMFPRLNELFDVKHIRDDLNNAELADPEVYTLEAKLKRLLVTYNIKDFRQLALRSHKIGIIGISLNPQLHQIDTKLTELILRSSQQQSGLVFVSSVIITLPGYLPSFSIEQKPCQNISSQVF